MNQPKTAYILVCYYPEQAYIAIGMLNILAKLMGVSTCLLVVNNQLLFHTISGIKMNNWHPILGSNKDNEFSGWQEGLDFIRLHYDPFDYVVFANDAIARPGCHLNINHLFQLASALKVKTASAAVGVVHSASEENHEMATHDMSLSPWITTGIFALSSGALHALEYRINYCSCLEHLVCTDNSSLLIDPSADKRLSNHIHSWLLGSHCGGWYRSQSLANNPRRIHILREKCRMILAEFTLSGKLRQHGVKIIDIGSYRSPQSFPFKLIHLAQYVYICIRDKCLNLVRAARSQYFLFH